jgi:tetratricopeptide (TPR) repeat protein
MLGFAWLTIRQAQEALKNGRLEEAHRLLAQPAAQGHKRSWELQQQLARAFVERGERHLRHDDDEAAWSDLLQAEQLGSADSRANQLRQALFRLGVVKASALLQAGEPSRAAEIITPLKDRGPRQPDLEVLDEAARSWQLARDLGARGEFAQALQAADRARQLLAAHPAGALDRFRAELELRQQTFASLLVQLHEAVDQARWRDVVEVAEKVLAAAPQHEEARKARTRAWKAIQPVTVALQSPVVAAAPLPDAPAAPQRFLLWIDGVGGYLVCLGSRVTLGQATTDSYVDVPIFADVSRLHAILTRDAEGYLFEAVRPAHVNGQPVDKALLRANDRLTLGTACQFQFRQPAPVSTSARLDLTSGHRLPLALDGVLLMADTLVLGPGSQVHVSLPDVKHAVVLFRHKDGLGVRCAGRLSVGGQPCGERAVLGPKATVAGEDFGFAIEPVGTRMGRL